MAEQEKDKGFEVVDKRKVTVDKDGEVHTHPEVEAAEAKQEEPRPDLSGLPPIDVYALIRYFIGIMSAQVWQWLGIVKSPLTGDVERDLEQAKVAIDTVSMLIGRMEPKLSDAEKSEYQGLLSDLRINYVQQTTKQ